MEADIFDRTFHPLLTLTGISVERIYLPGTAAATSSWLAAASAAAMTGTVRRKLSGFSEMESIPSATKNCANSG